METNTLPPQFRVKKFVSNLPVSLIFGAIILLAIVSLSLLSPYIAPFPNEEMHFADRLLPPNLTYLAGTDEYGRDVLSRVLWGGRLSLFIGFSATVVGLLIGVPLGLIAGYRQGSVDEIMMRIFDLLMSFPPILLVLLILSVTDPSILKTTAVVGLLSVPALARLTRSVTLAITAEEFVLAAHARGERVAYILFREILPNAWPAIIVEASLRITFAILVAAVLSFLGFGVRPPDADWGMMIGQSRSLLHRAPWIAIAPGIAMGLTVVAINLLGDGLRVYLDPRARNRGSR